MSRLANIGFRAKLLGAFGVVLVILVLLSSIAYRTTVMNQEATDAVTHTLQVINLADETLANVLDMETSYRGFLLSGDEAMLQSYRTANDEIDDNLAELHELTVDNPPQSERWQSVELQVLDWRTNVAAPGIRLRREVTAGRGTIDDVTRWVVSGEGQRRTSGIRATIQQAVGVEQGLLEQRQDEATSRRLVLETMLIVGSIAAIALGLILATLLSADLTGPIRRLASTAQEIAGGQLDLKWGISAVLAFVGGLSCYVVAVRFMQGAGIQGVALQSALWFVVTGIGVAIMDASILQWSRTQQVVGVLVAVGLCWLIASTAASES